MKFARGRITIAIAITVAALSSILAFSPNNNDAHIDRIAQWNSAPTIRVCNIAPTSVREVATAAKWWQDLGYEFDLIYSTNCVNTIQFGTITVTLDEGRLLMNNLLGRTTFYSDTDTNEMYWVKIELRSPYTTRVLEHELGHALGWLHTRTEGHMMHPNHFDGGWDFIGLDISEAKQVDY